MASNLFIVCENLQIFRVKSQLSDSLTHLVDFVREEEHGGPIDGDHCETQHRGPHRPVEQDGEELAHGVLVVERRFSVSKPNSVDRKDDG